VVVLVAVVAVCLFVFFGLVAEMDADDYEHEEWDEAQADEGWNVDGADEGEWSSGGGNPPWLARLRSTVEQHSASVPNLQIYFSAVLETLQLTEGGEYPSSAITPTSLMACLVTSLTDGKQKTLKDLFCLVHLLSLVLPLVTDAVLSVSASHLGAVLFQLIQQYGTNHTLAKPLFTCAKRLLLGALPQWNDDELLQIFKLILSVCFESSNVLVKAAQRSVHSIMLSVNKVRKGPAAPVYRALDEAVTVYCATVLKKLSNIATSSSAGDKSAPSGGAEHAARKSAQACLSLLTLLFPLLSQNSISSLCLTILERLPSEPSLCLSAFTAIDRLFEANTANVRPVFVHKLISALALQRPHHADPEPSIAYTFLVSHGYAKLYALDQQLCKRNIASAFVQLFGNFQAVNPALAYATSLALKDIVIGCIDQEMIVESFTAIRNPMPGRLPSAVQTIMNTLIQGFEYQYQHAWGCVLSVLSTLFLSIGAADQSMWQAELAQFLKPVALPMCELKLQQLKAAAAADGDKFPFNQAVNKSFACLIRSISPQVLLEIIPLNLGGDSSEARDWLLPLMKDNVSAHSSLMFFAAYFVRVYGQLEERIAEYADNGMMTSARWLRGVANNIWELFPSFCNHPSEVVTGFPRLAEGLHKCISELGETSLAAVLGLQRLIETNSHVVENDVAFMGSMQEFPPTLVAWTKGKRNLVVPMPFNFVQVTPAEARANLECIASFAPNFLPTLFNILGAAPQVLISPLHRVLSGFLSVTPTKVVTGQFTAVVQKLLGCTKKTEREKPESIAQSQMFLSVLADFVPHLKLKSVRTLLRAITPFLTEQQIDDGVQKKAYTVLEQIVEHHPNFVLENIDMLCELLLQTASLCRTLSKRRRLQVMGRLIAFLTSGELTLNAKQRDLKAKLIRQALLGECILCTREHNKKTREIAISLLIELANAFVLEDSDQGANHYVELLMGGLGGGELMISATLHCLARVLFHLKGQVGLGLVERMLETGLILMQSGSREVLTSAYEFLKVEVSCLNREALRPHLRLVVERVLGNTAADKHYRQDVRLILVKLYRKFGLDELQGIFPEANLPVLFSVHRDEQKKQQEREAWRLRRHGTAPQPASSYEALLVDSDDEEAAADRASVPRNALRVPVSSGTGGAAHARQQQKKKQTRRRAWILPDDDPAGGADPLDFLDPQIARRVVTTNPSRMRTQAGSSGALGDQGDFGLSKDGRLLITDLDASDSAGAGAMDIDSDRKAGGSSSASASLSSKLAGSSSSKSITASGPQRIGRKINRDGSSSSSSNKRTRQSSKHSGERYKSSRAAGDMMRPGRLEPFAYTKLNANAINPRHRHKVKAQLKETVFRTSGNKTAMPRAQRLKKRRVREEQLQQQREQQQQQREQRRRK